VPNFGLDELLSLMRSERGEREHRLVDLLRRHELDPVRATELGPRVDELLARAAAKSPPPSSESVALGILSLLVLEGPP
jgi:hypothetical protein